MSGLPRGTRVADRLESSDRKVVLEAAELDPVEQRMRTSKLFCGPDGLRAFPITSLTSRTMN